MIPDEISWAEFILPPATLLSHFPGDHEVQQMARERCGLKLAVCMAPFEFSRQKNGLDG